MSNNTTVLVVPGPKVVTVLGIPSVYTGPISPTRGGTGLSSYVIGDLLYASASNALAALAGNTTATRQFLSSTGTGSAAQAPSWAALTAGDIPSLDASKITSGTVAPVRLGSGTPTSSTLLDGSGAWRGLAASDVPSLDASKITSGTLNAARLPSQLTLTSISATDSSGISLQSNTGTVVAVVSQTNLQTDRLGGRSQRLGVGGGSNAGQGVCEFWSALSVSSGHSFNSFPDPGAGGGYFNSKIQLGTAGTVDNTKIEIVGTSSGMRSVIPSGLDYSFRVGSLEQFNISTNLVKVPSSFRCNSLGGNTGSRLSISPGPGSAQGVCEFWSALSVASGISFGSFPDPGSGGIYAQSRLRLGAGATVDAASSELVGTANGVQINAPTGSTVALSTNGTTRASVGLNGLVFASGATTAAPGNISIGSGAGATMSLNVPSGGLYLFGENGTSGVVIAAASQYLQFQGQGGILGAAGNAGHCYIAGGNVAANSSCAYIRVYGVSASSNAGQAVYACGNVAGAKHSFVDGSGTERLTIDETALTISKPVNLGNASTVTAANNQIVGTSTGPKVNSTSGQYVEILNGNTVCAQFGRGALGAAARWWNIGGYASGGSYDNTLFGIDATSVSGTINIGTSGQFQVWSAGSATALLRFGYALGTANVGAWGIGRWASSQTATSSGLGSTGDGNMSANVANSGRIDIGANGTTRRAMQHVGGVIIGDLGSQVTIANSSTTTLMTATNRYGRLEIFDNTGQWATIRLANAATPVLEAGSANFAITASPTSAQLGINLSAGSLQLIAGSAAATTISANFRGM